MGFGFDREGKQRAKSESSDGGNQNECPSSYNAAAQVVFIHNVWIHVREEINCRGSSVKNRFQYS